MGIFNKRAIRTPLILLTIVSIVTAAILLYFHILIGLVYLVVIAICLAYGWKLEHLTYREVTDHVESLSYRVKNVGEEAFMQMPFGIVLVNEDFLIEWVNPYMKTISKLDVLTGKELFVLSEELYRLMKPEELREVTITLNERQYSVYYVPENRLLYFFDVTEQLSIESKYLANRTVLAILFMDNYDEITSMMDDQGRSTTNSAVTSIINDWAERHGVYIKRVASDRFIAVLNEQILEQLEVKKFEILDEIREKTANKNLSLTLSIGVGTDSESLIELGSMAQSSLDLVLGRGGDQVAIKQPSGKIRFYGGKTNPVEKRTRVRARVISHALRDLIQDSDKVFIMGHRNPDMDSIGAAIGVRKMAAMNQVEGYIVLNFDELNGSVQRLMNEIEERGASFADRFIDPEEALSKMTSKSLLIIVDTHKPTLTIDKRLFNKTEKVVVIDHHRRGEEFIETPTLVYMEPYASSTAELVTELLEYQPKHEKLTMLEATSLLSGIIVDTKSFTLRTGARTFEAASYLRTHGADTILIHRLLKEDLDTYVERSKIIQTVEFVSPGIAIAQGEEMLSYDSVLLAQTADILLSLKDVGASFVIARRHDGLVGISARSLGDINVQVVMERLGGGGHLTNAATQLEGVTVQEAKQKLTDAILEMTEGSSEI